MSFSEKFVLQNGPESAPISPLPVPDPLAAQVKLVVFDFDGVFTDNAVWVSETGEEWVRCSRGDGYGLKLLREQGISLCVLSSEINPVVQARCTKLKLDCYQGFEDKSSKFAEIVEQYGVSLMQTAYVGNDINDICCLQQAGVSVAVSDAFLPALAAARYQTQLPGGHGAVREVCEWIFACRQALVDPQ